MMHGLCVHSALQVDSHVAKQPLFAEPRRVQDRYAAGEDSGDDTGKVGSKPVRTLLHTCSWCRAINLTQPLALFGCRGETHLLWGANS